MVMLLLTLLFLILMLVFCGTDILEILLTIERKSVKGS